MSHDPRRSSRTTKGMPPNRFVPYDAVNRRSYADDPMLSDGMPSDEPTSSDVPFSLVDVSHAERVPQDDPLQLRTDFAQLASAPQHVHSDREHPHGQPPPHAHSDREGSHGQPPPHAHSDREGSHGLPPPHVYSDREYPHGQPLPHAHSDREGSHGQPPPHVRSDREGSHGLPPPHVYSDREGSHGLPPPHVYSDREYPHGQPLPHAHSDREGSHGQPPPHVRSDREGSHGLPPPHVYSDREHPHGQPPPHAHSDREGSHGLPPPHVYSDREYPHGQPLPHAHSDREGSHGQPPPHVRSDREGSHGLPPPHVYSDREHPHGQPPPHAHSDREGSHGLPPPHVYSDWEYPHGQPLPHAHSDREGSHGQPPPHVRSDREGSHGLPPPHVYSDREHPHGQPPPHAHSDREGSHGHSMPHGNSDREGSYDQPPAQVHGLPPPAIPPQSCLRPKMESTHVPHCEPAMQLGLPPLRDQFPLKRSRSLPPPPSSPHPSRSHQRRFQPTSLCFEMADLAGALPPHVQSDHRNAGRSCDLQPTTTMPDKRPNDEGRRLSSLRTHSAAENITRFRQAQWRTIQLQSGAWNLGDIRLRNTEAISHLNNRSSIISRSSSEFAGFSPMTCRPRTEDQPEADDRQHQSEPRSCWGEEQPILPPIVMPDLPRTPIPISGVHSNRAGRQIVTESPTGQLSHRSVTPTSVFFTPQTHLTAPNAPQPIAPIMQQPTYMYYAPPPLEQFASTTSVNCTRQPVVQNMRHAPPFTQLAQCAPPLASHMRYVPPPIAYIPQSSFAVNNAPAGANREQPAHTSLDAAERMSPRPAAASMCVGYTYNRADVPRNLQARPVLANYSTEAPHRQMADYYVDTYEASRRGVVAPRGQNEELYGGRHHQSQQYAQSTYGADVPMPHFDRPARRGSPGNRRSSICTRLHDLPKFSGRPEEWPRFICVFQRSTREHGYDDLDNMERLDKALSGEAKRMAEGLMIRPEHVGKTIDALARAFGRPDLLADNLIADIRQMPKMTHGRLDQIVSFSFAVDRMCSFLDGPETRHLLSESILLRELVVKMPLTDQKAWSSASRHLGPNPTIPEFAKWLSIEANIIANMRTTVTYDAASARQPRDRPPTTRDRHVLLNVGCRQAPKNSLNCTFCGEVHLIDNCTAFQNLSYDLRLTEARKRKLCYGCLGNDHLLPRCDMKKRCEIDGCETWHHHLLHNPCPNRQARAPQANTGQRNGAANQSQSEAAGHQQLPRTRPPSEARDVPAAHIGASRPDAVLSCQGHRPKQTVYFRVVPVILYGINKQLRTHALLDEGSSLSLVDADIAEQLSLGGPTQTLTMSFVSGAPSIQPSRSVNLGISGTGAGDMRYNIEDVQTAKDLSLPIQSVDRNDVIESNPHLAGVPFDSFGPIRPKVLLGLEHHHLGVAQEMRTDENHNGLVAARTGLGWVLYGSNRGTARFDAHILHNRRHETEGEEDRLRQLHELVRWHFTTEEFGVKIPSEPVQSDEHRRAKQILDATTRRTGDRFETGLLWRKDNFILPDSYPMALRRLLSVEAKMHRDPVYAEQYRRQINEYVQKGYARKLSKAEAAERTPNTWYLPHFAVQSASKPGKFRLVFDAAAVAHNVSLNSMLIAGPDLNQPLARLLFRFRIGAVGVCADVKEMFHQVAIRAADQNAQRFLWRDQVGEPSTYIMNVMTFGSSCSPTAAQFVKNLNASDFADQFPEAAAAIIGSHYVDDYVISFPTSTEARKVTAEVIAIHKRGGFDLRGVVSNCPEVRACFGGDSSASQSVSLEPEDTAQKILGMTWELEDDTFGFRTRFHRVNEDVINGFRKPTKREMLSVTMSIFDPFGLLANFLLPSKALLQELWRLGSSWDDPVPDHINDRWQEWRGQLVNTRRVKISRCYSPSITSAIGLQLHIFADASEEAFAAAAYWRVEAEEGVELMFVAGKARCAPLKLLTIPRLELQAAVLATRLMCEIHDCHENLHITKTVLWSDSETVLKWLRCDQRRYVQFVAFRVAEVVEKAPPEMWRYVPTALNVADDATRVSTPITFDPESRWIRGPAWLKNAADTWPQQPSFTERAEDVADELRPRFVGAIRHQHTIQFDRFSKWTRLVRSVAWARRFSDNSRSSHEKRSFGELTAGEVEAATKAVWRLVQAETYGHEIERLRSGKHISNSSSLFLLKPYLDADGVMRLHGRTDLAEEEYVPSAAKRPVILPHNHYVTTLIVRRQHELMAHQLIDATIAGVRSTYWVPKLRTLVKSVQRECPICRLRSAKPHPPPQGQLPRERLAAYTRPFTATGLDFFGPYQVTVGRRREKRWVALFTCLSTRAVHLEVAADLSTDACLICIRNLCHIRGVPAVIWCDNGTNFIGAKNELERHKEFFDPDVIQRELSVKAVEWRFNCPNNPEAGGAWERLVQAVKKVLTITLHEEAPRVETFRALLLEAANVVNSRPLTHIQVEPDDADPLTPNHFLIGGPNVATVPNPADVEPTATRKQWQICRWLSQKFWAQFVKEYLPELTRRSRHYPDQQPLRVGDVVFICDESLVRGKWTRGVIVAVAMAKDGEVRTATVRTAHGTYRRPATRLAKIDLSPSSGKDVQGEVSRTGPDDIE